MFRLITFFTFERLVALFAISTVLFLGLTFTVGFAWSWFFLLIMIFLVLRYIMLGSVGAAARKLQTQDFDGADKMLGYTWKPELLQFGMHGMYYFLKGTISMQKQDFNGGAEHMKTSLKIGLPDADSQAMAYLNLCGIEAKKGNKIGAKDYLDKAKKAKSTQPMIIDNIDQLDKGLKQQAPTMYQQFQMQGRGGFRKK
jgi:hypothetical protein